MTELNTNHGHRLTLKVVILNISVLFDIGKKYGYRGSGKCGSILQVPELWKQQTLLEQRLCQKYKRRATGVSVRSAAKQIKESVNYWPFP